MKGPEASADIIVAGASIGGVMAALRAAQAGARILLLSEYSWLGGQFTSQAVPADEHAWIEQGGASPSYRRFREALRAHYRAQPDFLDRSTLTEGCNPGDGWVSRICVEPAVAAQAFEELLRPQVEAHRLRIVRGVQLLSAQAHEGNISHLRVRFPDGSACNCRASVFVDGTDTGELIALAGLAYRVGKEARSEHGEPDAPERADPLDQQPITHVFALRWCDQPKAVVEAPPQYAFWCQQVVLHYGHGLFSESLPGLGGRSSRVPLVAQGSELDWWRYRRIVSSAQWRVPRAEVTLVNWAQNDHARHPLIDGPLSAAQVLADAREQSRALLHWLQTEAPRPDGGCGWPEWQLAPDLLGTADGFAMQAYVRESRRIVARDTLSQRQLMQDPVERADSVGIGWYNLDIHPTCISGLGCNAPVRPFEIPLGCFIPQAGGNLVPACKNIGVTHLANACTRVHPVEWLVGEVAGLLAVMRLRQGWPETPAQRDALRRQLTEIGVPLHWPPEWLAQQASAH